MVVKGYLQISKQIKSLDEILDIYRQRKFINDKDDKKRLNSPYNSTRNVNQKHSKNATKVTSKTNKTRITKTVSKVKKSKRTNKI